MRSSNCGKPTCSMMLCSISRICGTSMGWFKNEAQIPWERAYSKMAVFCRLPIAYIEGPSQHRAHIGRQVAQAERVSWDAITALTPLRAHPDRQFTTEVGVCPLHAISQGHQVRHSVAVILVLHHAEPGPFGMRNFLQRHEHRCWHLALLKCLPIGAPHGDRLEERVLPCAGFSVLPQPDPCQQVWIFWVGQGVDCPRVSEMPQRHAQVEQGSAATDG